jgi:hypothetical protein
MDSKLLLPIGLGGEVHIETAKHLRLKLLPYPGVKTKTYSGKFRSEAEATDRFVSWVIEY